MNYKLVPLFFGALLADMLLGLFIPGAGAVLLIIFVFFLARGLPLFEALFGALLGGFLLDLSVSDGSIFNAILLGIEAISIGLLSRKVLNFENKFTQILYLSTIFLTKVVFGWLLFDRAWPSEFLVGNLLLCVITIAITNATIMFKNVTKA